MATSAARTPWHLWLVGGLGLLWNGFGVYDYLMTKTMGAEYLGAVGMTDAQIAYAMAMPAWMSAVWAVGVWGALAGTLLLLARRRLAAPVFAVSLAAFVVSLLYAFLLSNGREVMGNMIWMQAVVLAGCLFFAWYSRAMARAGVLR